MTTKAEIREGYRKRRETWRINLPISYRKFILLIIDLLLINIAGLMALLLRFDFLIPKQYLHTYLKNGLFTTVIMVVIFYVFNLYQSVWKYASLEELMNVVGSSVVGSAVLFIVYNLILNIEFPRSFYILFTLLLTFFMGGSRFI